MNWILPKLGHCEVAALTAPQIRAWVALVAEGRQTNFPQTTLQDVGNDEQIRRRRASANRMLSVLKAALNHAFDEGRVSSNAAWGRRVKKFRGIASTRARYLTVEEAKKIP